MTPLTILIPAAGASSRMRGTDKLLERVEDQPLLRRQVLIALPLAPVIVTLRPDDPRAMVLQDLKVTILTVPDAATGLSASLRAAARSVTTALMILPADMPELTSADLAAVIAAFDHAPQISHRGAGADGTPGHPVILPARYLTEIINLSGDNGARSLLARDGVNLVPLPGAHATTDLDTPEDWARWRR
jgi:molybdenum cofactor cytidylyltransferase